MDKIKTFFGKEWTTEERILVSLVMVLGGILLGILLSPARSISLGNNNANNYGGEDEYEYEGEEE